MGLDSDPCFVAIMQVTSQARSEKITCPLLQNLHNDCFALRVKPPLNTCLRATYFPYLNIYLVVIQRLTSETHSKRITMQLLPFLDKNLQNDCFT